MASLSAVAWSGCSVEPLGLGLGDKSQAVTGDEKPSRSGDPLGVVVGDPAEEVCDGEDNDLDGQVDESDPLLGLPCTSSHLGICAPGTFACQQPAGTLVCIPTLQPQVEDCSTPEDEDCDGFGGCSDGVHLWSRSFQGAGQQAGGAITLDGAGNMYVTADFNGTVDFGTGPLTATGNGDPLLLKLDSSGNTVWARQFNDTGYGRAVSARMKPSGNIVLVGFFSGFVDFGLGLVRSMGDGNDLFAVELDPAGNTVWARNFDGVLNDTLINVTVDASGNAYLTGGAEHNIDFGTGLLSGTQDGFLVKLDPLGNTLWAKRFVGAGNSYTSGGLMTASGDILLSAIVRDGSIDFGSGAISTIGYYDTILARFDPAGNLQAVHQYGWPGMQNRGGFKLDSSGNIILSGVFYGTINFGAGPLVSIGNSADQYDGYIVKLDPSYNVIWQKQLGGPGMQNAAAFVDAADNVIGVSSFQGSIDFGLGPINAAAAFASDAYVVKYDAVGNLLWNKTFGDAAYQYAGGPATDASGNIYFTGGFMGSINFGGATFTNPDASGFDMFIVKLGP